MVHGSWVGDANRAWVGTGSPGHHASNISGVASLRRRRSLLNRCHPRLKLEDLLEARYVHAWSVQVVSEVELFPHALSRGEMCVPFDVWRARRLDGCGAAGYEQREHPGWMHRVAVPRDEATAT